MKFFFVATNLVIKIDKQLIKRMIFIVHETFRYSVRVRVPLEHSTSKSLEYDFISREIDANL